MALARLLADLEPVKRTDVTFLFSKRFDSTFDEDTIAYVSQKFNVDRFKGRKHATGWPDGPNGLMRESYTHCIERCREKGNKRIVADGILFMEPDCVPLHKEWLNLLIAEWKACGKRVLGAWLMKGDAGCEHINGNCIIAVDLYKEHIGILGSRGGGWDADAAGIMLPNGAASKLIFSDYGLGKPGYNDWKGCDYLFQAKRYGMPTNQLYGQDLYPVWYHGPKIMEGINCVRERLLGKPLFYKRSDLAFTLNQMGLVGTGAEIGVFRGENAESILSEWKGEKLLLVDPWINQTKKEYLDGCRENDFNVLYDETVARLSRFGERAAFRRQTSKDAASSVPDGSLDFVYIDAKHDYASVKEDIALWWPKVKVGGLFAGHDYLHASSPGIFDCGVTQAVDEFAHSIGWPVGFTPDDDVKSWYFVKKT